MSRDVLFDFDKIEARRERPGIGHNAPPAGVPLRMLKAYSGAFLVLLVSLSLPAMGAAPMPIVFAICLLFFAAYFGGMLLSPFAGEARNRGLGARIAMESGDLSVSDAAWQILLLPGLLAGFGLFAAGLKAFLF